MARLEHAKYDVQHLAHHDEEGFARLEGVSPGTAKVYYGEDPRPCERLPILALAADRPVLEELGILCLEAAEVDLPPLLLEASECKPAFTLSPLQEASLKTRQVRRTRDQRPPPRSTKVPVA